MKHLPEPLRNPPFSDEQIAWLQSWMDYWRTRARVLIAVCTVFVLVLFVGLAVVVIEKEQLREQIRRDVGVAVVCSAEDQARTLVAISQEGKTPTAAEKEQADRYIATQRKQAEKRVAVLLQGKPVDCTQG